MDCAFKLLCFGVLKRIDTLKKINKCTQNKKEQHCEILGIAFESASCEIIAALLGSAFAQPVITITDTAVESARSNPTQRMVDLWSVGRCFRTVAKSGVASESDCCLQVLGKVGVTFEVIQGEVTSQSDFSSTNCVPVKHDS